MKKKNIMILMISLSLVLLLGSSYALLRSTKVGTNPYVMNVANLKVEFADNKTNILTLENQVPIKNKEGLAQDEELVFTVTNTGTYEAGYKVYMEETSTNPEFKNVIRYIVNKENQGYYEIKNLGKDKYIEKADYLDINESKEYRVKLWLDYDADETYMDKTFTAKIVVETLQADNLDKSDANSPELVSNLIPVYYDEGEKVFKKADSKNLDSKYKWYDYENNMEAEVVKIKNNNTYIIDNENKTFSIGKNDVTYFNGSTDYYDLGYAKYDFKNSISVVVRFKINNLGENPTILSNTEYGGFSIQFETPNNQIKIYLHFGDSYKTIQSDTVLKPGEWYTVILNYDGNNYNLYINGKKEGQTISVSGNITPSPNSILLGAEPDPDNLPESWRSLFDGTISDVYIYTKSLTTEQINNYFAGKINDYPKENLLMSNKDLSPKEKKYTLVDNGIYFDGVDDYLNLGYANYNFKNAISFVLRVNLKQIGSDYHTLLSNTEGGGISLLTHDNVLQFNVHINGSYNNIEMKPNIDTWYTVVGTYDGKSVKLYVNGELKGTIDIVGNITPSIKNIILGAEPDGNIITKYSNATISDAFVYTDALTEDEIKNYFNGEINYYPKDNVLISYNGFKETTDMEEFYQKALNGVKIMDYDIEANFKWIPRFQYDTNLKFIKGIGKPEKTHAAFTYNNKELLGYYVTDNNDVKINNIENISDYHAITSNELDGIRKLNPSDNVEYKQALAIFQE